MWAWLSVLIWGAVLGTVAGVMVWALVRVGRVNPDRPPSESRGLYIAGEYLYYIDAYGNERAIRGQRR